MDRTDEHHSGHVHGDDQLFDHPDLATGDLSRNPHQSPGSGQRRLLALGSHGLPARHGRARHQPRSSRRHRWSCARVQSRIRGVLGGVSLTRARSVSRQFRRPVARGPATRARRGRCDALRQLRGHLGRRLPGQSARPRHGRESNRRHRWIVHWTDRRGTALHRRLASRLLGLGTLRHHRHRLELQEPSRHRDPHTRQDRLVGQPHLRGGPHRVARGHRLRHRALRHQFHGLDLAVGARLLRRRCGLPSRVLHY